MPLLDLFWSMILFFLFFLWIWLVISVFIDIFRSHDMSGWLKAVWVVFVLVIPVIGVLVYLIARGDKMAQRRVDDAKASEAAFKDYVQQAAAPAGSSSADEITKLAGLRDSGVITAEEFDAQKAKLLG